MRIFGAAVAVAVFVACSPSGGGGTGGGGGGLLGGGGGSSGGGGGSGGGAADAGQGTQNCVWLGNCVDPCAATDTACLDACAAQATASALTKWNAYADCSNTHNCQDTACINTNCAVELAACQQDSGGGGTGYTTSGSCLVVVNIPSAPMQSWCWDYQLTASGNHNDGSEHWWYYDAVSVMNGQSECTAANNRTFSMMVSGALDPATVSAGNLSNKRAACTSSSMYITMTWAENGTCGAAGSLGHCTWAVTNTYDPASSTVSSLTTTTWAVP